jgi:hypothetical protein
MCLQNFFLVCIPFGRFRVQKRLMNRDDNGKILPGRIHFEFQIRGSILPKRFSGVGKTSIPAFIETQLPEKVTYSAVPVYSYAYVLCADVVIRDGVIEPGKTGDQSSDSDPDQRGMLQDFPCHQME